MRYQRVVDGETLLGEELSSLRHVLEIARSHVDGKDAGWNTFRNTASRGVGRNGRIRRARIDPLRWFSATLDANRQLMSYKTEHEIRIEAAHDAAAQSSLGTGTEEIVEASSVLLKWAGGRSYGQPSGHGGTSLCTAIGA